MSIHMFVILDFLNYTKHINSHKHKSISFTGAIHLVWHSLGIWKSMQKYEMMWLLGCWTITVPWWGIKMKNINGKIREEQTEFREKPNSVTNPPLDIVPHGIQYVVHPIHASGCVKAIHARPSFVKYWLLFLSTRAMKYWQKNKPACITLY